MTERTYSFRAFAREIARREGKKKGVSIAQINEVLRCFFDAFYAEPRKSEALLDRQLELRWKKDQAKKGKRRAGK